jgi:hypothetical protein
MSEEPPHDGSTRMPNPVPLIGAPEHAAVPTPPARAGSSGSPTELKGYDALEFWMGQRPHALFSSL